MTGTALGPEILSRLERLATVSESPDGLTRSYLTAEHARAAGILVEWMLEAGMEAGIDPVGNVLGRLEGRRQGLPALVLGSHLDTVADAGRFDGALGLLTAISCVKAVHRCGEPLPFALEVYGFGDEEGYRFDTALVGSRAVAGELEASTLQAVDRDGVSVASALNTFGLDPGQVAQAARRGEDLLGYVELHIEQGPVLEARGQAVGVVTSIAGASRLRAEITGKAGHAGTVPMELRADALAAAAEAIAAVESRCRAEPGLVGTVGRIEVSPGAPNVIPGAAVFSVDIRSAEDATRRAAVLEVAETFAELCERRGVRLELSTAAEWSSTPCSPWLMRQLEAAMVAEGHEPSHLPSGAGHDAMVMASLTGVGMLFVRCRGGLSHHPDEHVENEDVEAAARLLLRFVREFEPVAGS